VSSREFLYEACEFSDESRIGTSSDLGAVLLRQLSDLTIDLEADVEKASDVVQSEFVRWLVHVSLPREGGTLI
jgi:hypothetical protein